MRLFIRIVDGKPFEHPIMEDNFVLAFPDIDMDNLPPEFAEFVRIGPPTVLGPYQRYDGVTYEWESNKVRDVHHIYEFTEAEKIEKQNQVKEDWAQNGYPSWIFNEEACAFISPVPYPDDGKKYIWKEETLSWEEFVPPPPSLENAPLQITILPPVEVIRALTEDQLVILRERLSPELLPQLDFVLATNG